LVSVADQYISASSELCARVLASIFLQLYFPTCLPCFQNKKSSGTTDNTTLGSLSHMTEKIKHFFRVWLKLWNFGRSQVQERTFTVKFEL